MKKTILSGCLITSLILSSGCQGDQYESMLRKQFDLPPGTQFIVIENAFGDGFKEKLRFSATFEFTDTDFNTYKQKVASAQDWHPLPISQSELQKIAGDQFIKTESLNPITEEKEELKSEPSTNNSAAKERARKRWRDTLYLDIKNGYYHCLTSGTDIMHSPKALCSKKTGRFNDLLLGVLDIDQKTLYIRAYTGY